jgi:hypothetical protein
MEGKKEVACGACSPFYTLGGRLAADAKYFWREKGEIRTSKEISALPAGTDRGWVLRKVAMWLQSEDTVSEPPALGRIALSTTSWNRFWTRGASATEDGSPEDGCGQSRNDIRRWPRASYSMSRVATLSRCSHSFQERLARPCSETRESTNSGTVPPLTPQVKGCLPEEAPRQDRAHLIPERTTSSPWAHGTKTAEFRDWT